MSVSKIKNLILLILALAIIGLLPAVVPTQAARVGSEKEVHEKLEALYESYGLSLDASSLPASQTLYSIERIGAQHQPDLHNGCTREADLRAVAAGGQNGNAAEEIVEGADALTAVLFKVCRVEAGIGVNSGGHGGKKAPSALDQLCLLARRRLKACGLHVGAR